MADDRIKQVIRHWASRFVSNGVPLHDFNRTTAAIETWNDWCAAWTATGAEHDALGDEAAAVGNTISAGEHYATAAACYHFGKYLFVHDIDQMRSTHTLAVTAYNNAIGYLRPPGERVDIAYAQHTLAGVLRRPDRVAKPPVVILIGGLDSTKEEMRTYEEPFLARGLATFSFDGPGQGEAEYDIPMRHDFEVAVAAVIDALARRSDVDASRIGLFGISLGGYYALRSAALEPRASACASISGPYAFGESWDARPPMSRAAFRVRSHLADEEAARQHAQRYELSTVAGRITCPTYVVAGTRDELSPVSAARRIADEVAGPVTLSVIEGGNHVVNNMPYRYRPQVADWMRQTLVE